MKQQKRQKVKISEASRKRRAARRRKRALRVTAFFLFMCICVFAVLSVTILFPVTKVIMKNEGRYTNKEIRNACSITSKDNMILLSNSTICERTNDKLPYAVISIKKTFPDTITLNIKDAIPKYCVSSHGKYYLTDKNMRSLEKVENVPEGITVIKVPDKLNVKVGNNIDFRESTQELVNMIMSKVSGDNISLDGVDASSDVDIKVIVNGHLLVLFGSDVDLEYKIKHLKAMLPTIDAATEGVINLKNWSSTNSKATFRDVKINSAEFSEIS